MAAAALGGAATMVRTAAEDGVPPDRAPGAPSGPAVDQPFRAFHAGSWWNTPVPEDAPAHPREDEVLDYLRTARESGRGCLMLAGAGSSPWGHPVYWARPSDPTYDVRMRAGNRPPELDRLRIPEGAQPADNSDGSMTVYDRARGYVVALTDADYDPDDDSWSASGATVTYLDSNGLHVGTGRSDDPRNTGTHRGNNGATMAVTWEEFLAGAVRHVVKVASGPDTRNEAVFPMIGSDGRYEGDDPGVPPQGLRLRIKPSVDLEELELHPQAQVIAEGLQRYGFYIGDSGGTTALKLENTVAEGRGQLWTVPGDGLCALPFTTDYWDVLPEGYDPTR